MVFRSGAGPRGCPIGKLNAKTLAEAMAFMRSHEVVKRAGELGACMSAEDGVSKGVESFHNRLPLANMICEVSIFNNQKSEVARVYCPTCGLKMTLDVDRVIHRRGSGRSDHERVPFRSSRWGVVGPQNTLEGATQGTSLAAYEFAGGIYDLFSKPVAGAREEGVSGAVKGVGKGLVSFIARPMIGGKMMVERVYTGVSSGAGTNIRPMSLIPSSTLSKSFRSRSKSPDPSRGDQFFTSLCFGTEPEHEPLNTDEETILKVLLYFLFFNIFHFTFVLF
jgi:hypothetical protein